MSSGIKPITSLETHLAKAGGQNVTPPAPRTRLEALVDDISDRIENLSPGGGGAVDSVNGQTGVVVLSASDVGALPSTTKLADLTDDSTHRTVTDTEKTAWDAKQSAITFDNAPTSGSSNPVTSDGIESAISTLQTSIANMLGIVINGNKTPLGASTGQYIILLNSTITGKTDGLYKATKTIPANTVIDGTYLSAVTNGLGGSITPLEANKWGTEVDLTGYKYGTQYFTAPTDGYVVVDSGTASGTGLIFYLFPHDTTSKYITAKIININGSAQRQVFFIKKGMQLTTQNSGSQTGASAYFEPLE